MRIAAPAWLCIAFATSLALLPQSSLAEEFMRPGLWEQRELSFALDDGRRSPLADRIAAGKKSTQQMLAQAQGRKVYEAVGAKQVLFGPTPPATHQMGTARMSHDPAAGVTNAHGQAHEVPNLFISDGSVFTTPGAANPTLTIVALVLRQADYIERQLKARAI